MTMLLKEDLCVWKCGEIAQLFFQHGFSAVPNASYIPECNARSNYPAEPFPCRQMQEI